jgi:hypothetical protein
MAKPLDQEPDIPFFEVHEVIVPHLGHVPIAKGDFNRLPRKVQKFVAFYVSYWLPLLLSFSYMVK